jgi:hypothetical protein
MPKVIQSRRKRPEEHPVHDMKNGIIQMRPLDLFIFPETFLGIAQAAFRDIGSLI